MGISNMTLVKIGAIGGIVTVTMGLALRAKIDSNIKQTEFYKEALKTLRRHKAAVHLMGEPIKEGSIDVGDSDRNYVTHYAAKYEVPVRGPKQKGILHIWAEKQTDSDKWVLKSAELDLQHEPERRLLIKGDGTDK